MELSLLFFNFQKTGTYIYRYNYSILLGTIVETESNL